MARPAIVHEWLKTLALRRRTDSHVQPSSRSPCSTRWEYRHVGCSTRAREMTLDLVAATATTCNEGGGGEENKTTSQLLTALS